MDELVRLWNVYTKIFVFQQELMDQIHVLKLHGGQMHNVISPIINIEDSHIIHCGMSLGYEDKNAEVNKLKTVREDLNIFTTFHE